MLSALKGLLTSKTYWLAVSGAGVLVGVAKIIMVLGLPLEMGNALLTSIAALFGVKGLQQAAADLGKNSIKIEPPK
jgi:hypothetical protein